MVYGGNVKNSVKLKVLSSLVLLSAGWWLAGCKSAPDLTQAQAQSMIQAKYDKDPGVTFNISVNDGACSRVFTQTIGSGPNAYPNGYWADFKLTPDGAKVVKLPAGGDVIQWRPDGPAAPNYAIVVVPLALSHYKARGLGDVETIGDTKTVTYMEDVILDAMPAAVAGHCAKPRQ